MTKRKLLATIHIYQGEGKQPGSYSGRVHPHSDKEWEVNIDPVNDKANFPAADEWTILAHELGHVISGLSGNKFSTPAYRWDHGNLDEEKNAYRYAYMMGHLDKGTVNYGLSGYEYMDMPIKYKAYADMLGLPPEFVKAYIQENGLDGWQLRMSPTEHFTVHLALDAFFELVIYIVSGGAL